MRIKVTAGYSFFLCKNTLAVIVFFNLFICYAKK